MSTNLDNQNTRYSTNNIQKKNIIRR
jgi:hypothetical protein